MRTQRVNCVDGITANRERLEAQVCTFVGLATALIPRIGYDAAARLAKEALSTHKGVVALVCRDGLMIAEDASELLTPRRLSGG